jgi:excisionase family DNA binding protein
MEEDNLTPSPPTAGQKHLPVNTDTESNAAPLSAATGRKEGGTDTSPTVAPPSGWQAAMARDFEPLTSSCEAARLLGNIHVKTLQRYARHQRIPGYQIGGHWYFRASELDAWLQSQINLSCHPCRLSKEAK